MGVQNLTSEKKQLLEHADELMARKAALEVAVGDLEARVEEEGTTKVCAECVFVCVCFWVLREK